jgi:DNA-binding PadR family transcriptional regulator
MPRRALDNPVVMAVLGLLLERPMHPYQMLSELHARSEHWAAKVRRGSLYDVVDTLVAAGWVAAHAREREGGRPERTTYQLTDDGHAELVRRLDAQIRTPKREFAEFLGAVGYVGALGRDGAAEALAERARILNDRIEHDERRLADALGGGVPRLYVIETEYALRRDRAELEWVTEIVTEILTGLLAWPQT